jgi:hypothetical protein
MLDWSKVKPATCRLCDQLIKESNGIIEEGEEDEFCITKPEFGLCVPCLCRCYNWCKKRMGVFTYCKPTDTEWAEAPKIIIELFLREKERTDGATLLFQEDDRWFTYANRPEYKRNKYNPVTALDVAEFIASTVIKRPKWANIRCLKLEEALSL